MHASTYQFKVGNFDCAAISDGTFTYAPPIFPPPALFLFANAPRERLAQALAEHGLELEQWEAWTSPYTCLLVNTGSSRVLIDTGGDGLGPNTGSLFKSLESVGVPNHTNRGEDGDRPRTSRGDTESQRRSCSSDLRSRTSEASAPARASPAPTNIASR